jgi:polyisoprenoid-binding protein YceI
MSTPNRFETSPHSPVPTPTRWLWALVAGALLLVTGLVLPAAVAQGPAKVARRTAEDKVARPRALQPGDVLVDSSPVYVFVGKRGFGHEHAVEGRLKEGTVRLGAPRDAGSLVFAMKTFHADSNEARKYLGMTGETDADTRTAVTANMLGANILSVDTHPEAVFKIRSALADTETGEEEEHYLLVGDFTLRGMTRPLSVRATVARKGGKARLRGQFTVKQTEYGITPFSKALGAIGVADELRIFGEVDLAAE